MNKRIVSPTLGAAGRGLFSALLAVLLTSNSQATNTQISSSGVALLQVVVKPGASTRVLASGSALAQKLSQISGATFTVVTGDGSTGIAVGLGTDFTGWPFSGNYFNLSDPTRKEDYVLRSHANGIYVAGASEASVEYAVWDLLYRMGYRQYTPSPNWEIVPSNPDLSIDVDVTEHPDYYARDIWYGLNTWGTPDTNASAYNLWKQKNRIGKGINLNTAHAYYGIIQRNAQAFADHPEYRALVNGVRTSTGSKFCISNPGLRQLVVDDTLAVLAANPNLQSVSLEPSDLGGWCECELCAAIGNGSISDRVVFLNNQVMEAVNAVYPNQKYIGMYAYSFHSPPPSIPVNPRIVVSVATRLTTPGWTTDQLLDGWGAKGATLGIRDYYSVNLWDRDLPGRALANNRKYISTSIPKYLGKGVHFMNAESGDNWGPCGFGYYLASRFLWHSPSAIPVPLLDSAGMKADGAAGENTYGLVLPVNASTGQSISISGSNTLAFTLMTNNAGNGTGPNGYFISYFPTKSLTSLGDKIKVSFTASLSGVSTGDQTFRLGLFNSGGNRLTANSLGSTSNSALNAYTGYRADYRATGTPSSLDVIRERTGLAQNLFSTGTMAPALSGTAILPGANIVANTPFACAMELEKTSTGVKVTTNVNGAPGTVTDTVSPFTSFDALGVFTQAQLGMNLTLTVTGLSVSYSQEVTAAQDNLAIVYNEMINNCFGPAAAPIDDLLTTFDWNSFPLLSNDLIGRSYGKVQSALNLTTDPKIRNRIYDLALYVRYLDLFYLYTSERDPVSRQAKFEQLIRFAYRIRGNFMVHSLALYRDLVGRDSVVTIPAGCEYTKAPPGNTWKVPSYGYTQAEIDDMITNGIASNPLLPWNPRSFTDDLVPATPLNLTSGTGNIGSFKGRYEMYTYFPTSPGTLSINVKAGTTSQNVGPAKFDLFQGNELTVDPVASGTIPEDRVVHSMTLNSEFPGLHLLKLFDNGAGTIISPISTGADIPLTIPVMPGDYAMGLRWTMYFYVPKGTTIVGGYAPYGAEGTINDSSNVVRHTFNPATGYYFSVPVPAGQDGKLWKFNNTLGVRMLMTVPPYIARSASALLLPREVVEADAAP